MNTIDILILIFLGFGGLIGFKQGLTRSLVSCVGYIVIIVLAFILKNPVSEFLMSVCPFFDFFGLIKGLTVFNIAFYEIVAFLLVFSILLIILKILMIMTNVFEKILTFTIILGIPSKILGMIVGVIKSFVIVFAVLYVLALANVNDFGIEKSKFKDAILNNTPLLSSFAGETVTVAKEFAELKDKYQNETDSNKFNLETLDLFLKYKVVTTETAQKLIDNGKLKIDGAQSIIDKYKEMEE